VILSPVSRTAVLALVALSGACAAADAPQPSAPPPAASQPPFIACTNPRPEICTRDYRPVCAQVDTGKRCVTAPCESSVSETRGNACSACGDPKVIGYRAGACPDKPKP
jgi:hypothetical protein